MNARSTTKHISFSINTLSFDKCYLRYLIYRWLLNFCAARILTMNFQRITFHPLLLIILLHLAGIQGTSAEMRRQAIFDSFDEQQRAGTLVGNIAVKSNLAKDISPSELNKLRYEFLDPSNLQTVSLFTLNEQTGGLHTSAMIDRESICEDLEVCLIQFDVMVSSEETSFVSVVSVSINITDKNDESPRFYRSEITLNIPEGNQVGITYPLPVAVDKDTRPNSVAGYAINMNDNTFDISVDRNLDDSFKVGLVVNKVLDREERDRYTVIVTARDGGNPSLTGTLTVNVNVTDVNDNAPQFAELSYTFRIAESTPVGMVVGRVRATDFDTGNNARIVYSFTTPRKKIHELFSLDPASGEINTIAALQYESGNTFECIVEARDSGVPSRVNQTHVNFVIYDVGNNPPLVEFIPKNPFSGNTIRIQEDARQQPVGTIKVTDNDPGLSGTVDCQSSHSSFTAGKFEKNSFLVRLVKQLDREHEENVNVTISCTDMGSPPMTAVTTFNVLVNDINDNAPVFSQRVYRANVTEETIKGTEVIRVSAQDADKGPNSQFYYYLHPEKNEMFSLDSKRGILFTNVVFDREIEPEVTVIVKAIDEGEQAMTGTATVVVQILDINDNAPSLTTTEFKIMEGEDVNTFVGSLSAHDKDKGINADVEYYMKASNPLPPFTVYQDGKITTNAKIDREAQRLYMFEVYMYDKGVPKMTSSATVTIVIEDRNDNSPEVYFPNSKNSTVTIIWSLTPRTPFATILASDPDDDRNAKLTYAIAGGNKNNLFEISRDMGTVYLTRYIEETDATFNRLKIAVRDAGQREQETQAILNIRIDLTNATFNRHEGPAEVEKNILIAGIVGGATIVISVVILVVIFQVRSTSRRPRRSKDPSNWQRDKTGIQEECGKTEMEKIAWKMSHSDIKGDHTPDEVDDIPDVDGGPSEHMTMGKVVQLPWSNEQKQVGAGNSHLTQSALDSYRKQDFYTFCKVRSPHDDVNSVTSGETTTSDSGRGGSEDDTALPPIAEVPPECGSQLCLSFDHHSERSTSPLSPVRSGFGPPETKIMPLSSFRESDNRKLFANAKYSFNDPGFHPYFGDKPINSSLKRSPFSSQPPNSSFALKNASGTGSHRSLPHNKNGTRQVTFSTNRSLPRYDVGKRAPYSSKYEHLLPETGGYYGSLSKGVDDEDGNGSTTGSYTLEITDLDECMS